MLVFQFDLVSLICLVAGIAFMFLGIGLRLGEMAWRGGTR